MTKAEKQTVIELVNRLSDTAASLDALEAKLVENGVLAKNTIGKRFDSHRELVEYHLESVRRAIASWET